MDFHATIAAGTGSSHRPCSQGRKGLASVVMMKPAPMRTSFGSLVGEVGLRLLDAAAKNPQAVVDTAVAVGNVYASREHNERIGWLHSLTKHSDASVRTASDGLLKALDAAGVKASMSVAPKLPAVPTKVSR